MVYLILIIIYEQKKVFFCNKKLPMTNENSNLIIDILQKEELTEKDIISLLNADVFERNILYKKSAEIKEKYIGKYTYYRGLIEFSNICAKDCFYCGIRKSNKAVTRYELDEDTILEAAKFAWENNYGSIALQGGEREDKKFVDKIDSLLKKIAQETNGELGVTLSLGEQKPEVYKRWLESGAHRYLLRIETTNKDLFYKIHPQNDKHIFERRIQALKDLHDIGYQTGTGVMIGLPFQTTEDLARDLLFFKEIDVDMIGMGPYIEHSETPLYEYRNSLLPLEERFNLTMKMIAVLRILMKDINIAAATAMQAIDPSGREKALKVGANVIMPNITPTSNRKNYFLYENKPCVDESAEECTNCLEARINIAGDNIGYGKRGDSLHFKKRKNIQ